MASRPSRQAAASAALSAFVALAAAERGSCQSVSCPADLDGDTVVGSSDLGLLLGAWGSAQPSSGDVDGNGAVDAVDLSLLLAAWGTCPLDLDGPLYEFLIEDMPITVGTSTGPEKSTADVWIQFVVGEPDDEGVRLLDVVTASVLVDSIPTEVGESGHLGFTLRADPPPGTWTESTGEFSLPLNTDGYYGLINDVLPWDWTGPDEEVGAPPNAPPEPITEQWTGHLSGTATFTGEDIAFSGSMSTRSVSPKTPYIVSTQTTITETGKRKVIDLPACPPKLQAQKLTICIQPVIFDFSGTPEGGSSGTTLAAMKAEADSIFAKACVELEWRTPIVIADPNGTYRDIEDVNNPVDLTAAANLVDSRGSDDCIEVFFHKRFMTPDGKEHRWGDGTSIRSGTAQTKVFVADAAAEGGCQNTRLLAHELGHAIGAMSHDADTFMKPTGNPPNCPGQPPAKVSAVQLSTMRLSPLRKVKQPKEPCCMAPDP
jgi:hypothetical protein